MKYPVVLHHSEYGYDVHCPLFPGCHSQGETEAEALENIKEAIMAYWEMIDKKVMHTIQIPPNINDKIDYFISTEELSGDKKEEVEQLQWKVDNSDWVGFKGMFGK